MAARRITPKTTRDTKVTSRLGDQPEGGEAPPAEQGLSFADTLILVTTLVMIAAFVLMDKYRGEAFNEGLFFKH